MKKFHIFSLLAVTASLGLTSCSPDDMPQITRLEQPQLNELATNGIDGTSAVYTFTWDAAKFYLDGNNQSTSVGSYEYQGIQYTLQGDLAGNEFASPVQFGSIVGKNYLAIAYEDIAQIMMQHFGMVRSMDETSTADLEFRLLATYGSNENTSVLSNVIKVPFTLTTIPPITGPKGKIYVCDLAGWGDVALYAWPESGSMPGWPGLHPTGSASKNGKTYYEFTLSDEYYAGPLNYIANNNNGGQQIDLMQDFTMGEEDVYVTVFVDDLGALAFQVDEDPAPKLFVNSALGWSDYSMYVWAGGSDVEAGWPGVHYTSVITINGETWYEFDMPRIYSKTAATNWILNDNGAGNQMDLMQGYTFDHDTFVRIAADGTFTLSNGPVLNGENQFTVYANIADSGWASLSFYVWGDLGELCGGWPGVAASGPFTINGNSYYYHTFTAAVPVNVIPNNSGGGSQATDINGNTDVIIKIAADNSYEVVKTF